MSQSPGLSTGSTFAAGNVPGAAISAQGPLASAASATGCSGVTRVAVSLKCLSGPLSAVCNFRVQEKVIFSSQ